MKNCLKILAFMLFIAKTLSGQDTCSISQLQLPKEYLTIVTKKVIFFEEKLEKNTDKALGKLLKQEQKIRKKLNTIDSSAASEIFGDVKNLYESIQKDTNSSVKFGSYIPRIDTLVNTYNFLQRNPQVILQMKDADNKLKSAVSKIGALNRQLNKAENLRQFMRERRQYLKEQLSKFGFGKELRKLNIQAYYYAQLIKDYKEVLNSPEKREKHALAILNKIPAFRKFIEKNSFLASIFGVPFGNPQSVSFTGLQTRASVQQRIMTSMAGASQNPAQFISQQLQTASSSLSALQNNIAIVDLSGSPEQMPDFKPNTQKTKPLLKRFELGANVQFGKTNLLLPSSGDFAFSLGYKLNDNGVIGIGSSYKLGIGSFERIQFTHQGFGFRSYIDWRIKSGFFFSGGYERNFLSQLNNINQPIQPQVWQESGLIGLSKRYSVGKKRKMTLQLLFDFLSYKNIPRSQPVIFRTGWIF